MRYCCRSDRKMTEKKIKKKFVVKLLNKNKNKKLNKTILNSRVKRTCADSKTRFELKQICHAQTIFENFVK